MVTSGLSRSSCNSYPLSVQFPPYSLLFFCSGSPCHSFPYSLHLFVMELIDVPKEMVRFVQKSMKLLPFVTSSLFCFVQELIDVPNGDGQICPGPARTGHRGDCPLGHPEHNHHAGGARVHPEKKQWFGSVPLIMLMELTRYH